MYIVGDNINELAKRVVVGDTDAEWALVRALAKVYDRGLKPILVNGVPCRWTRKFNITSRTNEEFEDLATELCIHVIGAMKKRIDRGLPIDSRIAYIYSIVEKRYREVFLGRRVPKQLKYEREMQSIDNMSEEQQTYWDCRTATTMKDDAINLLKDAELTPRVVAMIIDKMESVYPNKARVAFVAKLSKLGLYPEQVGGRVVGIKRFIYEYDENNKVKAKYTQKGELVNENICR